MKNNIYNQSVKNITPASPDAISGGAFADFSFRKRRAAYGSPRASVC
jgi:hypothetical protein